MVTKDGQLKIVGPTGTNNVVVNPTSGNVGIGTSTPQSGFKLYSNGASVTRGDIYLLNSINQFGTGDFNISAAGSNTIFKMSGSEKMRLTSGGSLLIGTTTDTGFKLNVSGSITTAGGSANITAPRHIVADSNAMIYRNNDNLTLLTYQSKNITFMPNNSESVRFLANGNVLIGTTSDNSNKLTVNGNIESLDTIILNYANNGIKCQHLLDEDNG